MKSLCEGDSGLSVFRFAARAMALADVKVGLSMIMPSESFD